MRRFIDLIALGLLILLLLGAVLYVNHNRRRSDAVEAARMGLERIQVEVDLIRALHLRETGERAQVPGVDPSWFDGSMPINALLPHRHRWMDVASAEEQFYLHPHRWWLAQDEGHEAMFWFNPRQGVVRARVPFEHSLEWTRAIYIAVNGEAPVFDRVAEVEPSLPPTGLETGVQLGQATELPES
ncbi:MAG: hypothetical protein ACO3P9_00255 [Phycisphaerales bacterium]|nr:hypothetical protein [Planctomycetota bacterium]